jgi:hypothetical protein
MKLLKHLAVPLALVAMIGCSDNKVEQTASVASTSSADLELAELNQLINLPIKPIRVKWEINKVSVPSGKLDADDWSLVARMEVEKKDLKILTNTPLPNKVIKLPQYAVEPWMEDILASKFKLDKTGEFYTPLATVLSAEQFYRDPLLTGAIYLISETEILLFLQTE